MTAPIIGSFLGTIIYRLPVGRDLRWPRSQCETCGATLRPGDLVPLFSWAASRGRCRYCGSFYGWFYPGVEIAALGIAAVALAVDGLPGAWLDSVFGWWLLVLGWIDLRHGVLPDPLTLPLIVVGLVAAALYEPSALSDRGLGAALGYLAFRAVAEAYRRLRGREGLGGGDAKLLAASGAWLGALALPQLILAAAAAALIAAGVLGLRGTRLRAHTALPFGPFIALAAWAIWLFGPLAV